MFRYLTFNWYEESIEDDLELAHLILQLSIQFYH